MRSFSNTLMSQFSHYLKSRAFPYKTEMRWREKVPRENVKKCRGWRKEKPRNKRKVRAKAEEEDD